MIIRRSSPFADADLGNLSLFWNDEHCKHVLLAGSADRGYVNFLRQFSAGHNRLTLVESVPFPSAFRRLAARFQVKKFDGLFRDADLVTSATVPQTTANSYAAAMALPPETVGPGQSSAISPPAGASTVSNLQSSTQRRMKFNRDGKRIDDMLPRWDNDIVKALEHKGLCCRFFLTYCGDPGCMYSHEGHLSVEERRALTRVARFQPCPNGTGCDDRNCLAGHHCIYDGHCDFRRMCRYGPEMHNVDKRVTQVT
jgi:hypothetical protein